ncbi:MAG: glycosyltransferase [Chloroflexota bacterium]|jgi:glycosyltransferase involved in cell wall biosynthesis
MKEIALRSGSLRLAWVSPIAPWKLDKVTWLDTTRELRAMGMEVTLLATGPQGPGTYGDVEVYNIDRPDIYLIGRILFHLKLLAYLLPRMKQYDFVLFHPISAVWLFPLRFMGKDRPLLVMDSRDLLDFGNKSIKARLRNNLERFTYWLAKYLADGQTAITTRLAQLVGIPSQQLWGIWPSGVNPVAFAESRRKRQPAADNEPIRLIYVGIFLEQRHLMPLAKAVRRANKSGMAFELVLHGDGPFRSALETYAAESEGNVKVGKPVPYDHIPALLAQAHIGVTSLPSSDDVKYEASSPLKLFEYMAAALPIISTANRCHIDVVGKDDYVFWASEPTEEELFGALEQVWASRDRLSDLGQQALKAVDQWTWAASAQKLFSALVQGLKHSPGNPAKVPISPEANRL